MEREREKKHIQREREIWRVGESERERERGERAN